MRERVGVQEGRNATAPKKDKPERKLLPTGSVAIITGKTSQGTPGDFSFKAEIGQVVRYASEGALRAGIRTEEVAEGFVVPKGVHAGWIGFKPVEGAAVLKISVKPFVGQVPDTAQLGLLDGDRARVIRSAEVNTARLVDDGFDLNQENPSNAGAELSLEASQLLYDFQLGQGQFAPQEQPQSDQAGAN